MKAYKLSFAVAILFFISCKNNQNGQQDNGNNTPGVATQPGNTAASAPGTIPKPYTPDLSTLEKNPAAQQQLSLNETNGVNRIKSYYGCECRYSKEQTNSQGKSKKIFRLEASGSPLLDSTKSIAELTVSNIAMLFYQNLAEDRSKYDEIVSSVVFSDGQRAVKAYPMATLGIVYKKTRALDAVIYCLKTRNYDKLASLLNDQNGVVQYNKQKLIEQIKSAEPQLGNVNEFVPYGFIFIKSNDQKDILHISGLLVRDKQNNEFSVDFDPSSTKEEAMFINYKL